MGAGSSITSSRPTFRTGNITTPRNPLVTERASATVRMGRDDAPIASNGIDGTSTERGLTMINGARIASNGRNPFLSITRDPQTGYQTGAQITAATAATDTLTGRERDDLDKAAGVYRQRGGGFVRTVDMGDAPITFAGDRIRAAAARQTAAMPTTTVTPLAPARAARPARADRDAEVRAFLADRGYSGPITATIRARALDAMAFAAQVADMAADARPARRTA